VREQDAPGIADTASTREGTVLASRYGRTRARSRRDKWWIGGVAAAFVVVFAAWVVWGGFDGTTASLLETDTAYTIVDAQHTRVSFTVEVDPGHAVACAVEAQNVGFSTVGWKIVEYPASTHRLRAFTETVRTTSMPVTGLVDQCWLT
jgi:hypothetical protein